MDLNITSYNCRSFINDIDFIDMLMTHNDILLLQETFLTNENSHTINDLESEICFISESATRKADCFTGRSSGGLAIIWRPHLSPIIRPFYYSNRILGIFITVSNFTYLLLNIYCPCDYGNDDSIVSFNSILADMNNIISSEDYDELIIAGDFNCSPYKGRFFSYFKEFLQSQSLFAADIDQLPIDSHTYISSNTSCSTNWLDHIVTSNNNIIKNINIMYGFCFEDHIPISFNLIINKIVSKNATDTINESSILYLVEWNKLSDNDICTYKDNLDYFLNDYNNDALMCEKTNCDLPHHRQSLNLAYEFLTDCIHESSQHFKKVNFNKKYKNRPGWNDECKCLYADARSKYIQWINNGKLRTGDLFSEMKLARAKFKKALRFCKNNELLIKKQKLLNSFQNKNKNDFWKNINSFKTSNINNTKSNHSDLNKINEFDIKYKQVFDDPNSQAVPTHFEDMINELKNSSNEGFHISNYTLRTAIENLKVGLGWDSIHSNHIKFASYNFYGFLRKLFMSFIKHSYVPSCFVQGEIRPVIKNAHADKNNPSSYRPIMNSSNLYKTLEYCLLPTFKKLLKVNGRQFSYQKNVGCLTAASLLKETVLNYNNNNSNVHCAQFDFSRAFDKLNLYILLIKMNEENVPGILILFMYAIFSNTYVYILLCNVKGSVWKIKNGTRQGGILSALFFIFYIDRAICNISNLEVGCQIDYYRLNIIAYADDILLMAASATGLKFLINKFILLINDLCIPINYDKCNYMVFKASKNSKEIYPSLAVNNNHNTIKFSNCCKYLGVIFMDNMSLEKDSERCYQSFLNQFNSLYYKFNFLNNETLIFLFQSYCSSFYGVELWYDYILKKNPLIKSRLPIIKP